MIRNAAASSPAGGSTLNAPAAAATAGRTNWDGVFSAAQVKRGQEVYRRSCSVCHLDTLQGDSVSSPLVGPDFMNRFVGSSVHDMVTAIRGSMPQNAPDSLGDQAYIDLIAYLLNANGSPTGRSELPTDVSELMRVAVSNQPQNR